MRLHLLLVVLILLISSVSCRYRMVNGHYDDGTSYKHKVYKDYDLDEKKREQNFFKYRYLPCNYDKYKGLISSGEINQATYIQYDSCRAYLFGDANKYKEIFISGLLSSQLIYCSLNEDCSPIQDIVFRDTTGKPIIIDLWGWKGYTLTCDNFQLLKHVNSKPTQRRFMFWIYPFKVRVNGSNSIMYLELTNDKANRKTDLSTFIKGARVTFLKCGGIMI